MKSPECVGNALGIVSPWKVTEFRISKKNNRLDIFVDFDNGTAISCPICETGAQLYRIKNKTWQHTNFMGYVAYLHAEVPSFICPFIGCGIFPYHPTWANVEDWEICTTALRDSIHKKNPKLDRNLLTRHVVSVHNFHLKIRMA